jgi:O-antigen/teichoic acid export membrane protein
MKIFKLSMLAQNIGASLVVKAASMIAGIAQIPYYLNYFRDDSTLAFWFVIISIYNILLYTDFGIGSGCKNDLVEFHENELRQNFYKTIGNAICSSSIIALILIAPLLLLLYCDSNIILQYVGSESINKDDAIQVFAIIAITAGLIFPLRIVVSVLHSLQYTAISTLIPLFTQLGMLCYLMVGNHGADSDRLLDLTSAYSILAVAPYFVAAIALIASAGHKSEINSILRVSIAGIIKTFRQGINFFMIQVCILLLINSNELIIFQIINADQVINYQIHYRFFSIFIVGFSVITVPLWSAISKSHIVGSFAEINALYRKCIVILLMLLILIIAASIFFGEIFKIFVGYDFAESISSATYLFGLFTLIYCAIQLFCAFLNGIGEINYQVAWFTIAVLLKFAFLYFYQFKDDNLNGVMLSTIIPLAILLIALIAKIKNKLQPSNSTA